MIGTRADDEIPGKRGQEPAAFLLPAIAGNSSGETSSIFQSLRPRTLLVGAAKRKESGFFRSFSSRTISSECQWCVLARVISDPDWWVIRYGIASTPIVAEILLLTYFQAALQLSSQLHDWSNPVAPTASTVGGIDHHRMLDTEGRRPLCFKIGHQQPGEA